MDNNTLPEELANEIARRAKEYSQLFKHGEAYREPAFIDGATEYATKLHPVQQENEHLKRWKAEATQLLDPIFDYADSHDELNLGQSKTDFVLDRAKAYDDLQAKADRMEKALREIMAYYPTGYFAEVTAREALAGEKEVGDGV